MASANVTLPGSQSYEFEVDTTQRTATQMIQGGCVVNTGSVDCFINTGGNTVTTTQPGGAENPIVPAGGTVILPATGRTFTFKTASGTTYLQYTPLRYT